MHNAFLYYWQLYFTDTAKNLIPKLNQNSTAMQSIAAEDTVWAITLKSPAKYALVGKFNVKKSGENPETDPDREKYGKFFFSIDKKKSVYFDFESQDNVEDTIRSLSIRPSALALGQSFQGINGVRPLSAADDARMRLYASALKPISGKNWR